MTIINISSGTEIAVGNLIAIKTGFEVAYYTGEYIKEVLEMLSWEGSREKIQKILKEGNG